METRQAENLVIIHETGTFDKRNATLSGAMPVNQVSSVALSSLLRLDPLAPGQGGWIQEAESIAKPFSRAVGSNLSPGNSESRL